MGKLRLGIIGCGKMTVNHGQSFKKNPEINDILDVTCVCDIIPEQAEAAKESYGAQYAFTDYKDMLDYVDAVLVVLPHDVHFECGMFFVQNKKHVLMEKPLCIKDEECVALKKAAEENGVKLMTAYCVRYYPQVLEMKKFIDEGLIGDVFHMSIWTEQWTKGADPTRWLNARGGGGQLFRHGCHYIDILLWFLGKPVRGYHIGNNFATPWLEGEGTSDVVIEFESGAIGYHMGTWGAVGTRHGWEIQIHGTKGMLAYSKIGEYGGKVVLYKNIGNKKFHNEDPNATDIEILWETDDIFGKKTAPEVIHFADCIINDKEPNTNAHQSIQGLRVIRKLYEAEKNGTIADLRGLSFEDPIAE